MQLCILNLTTKHLRNMGINYMFILCVCMCSPHKRHMRDFMWEGKGAKCFYVTTHDPNHALSTIGRLLLFLLPRQHQ